MQLRIVTWNLQGRERPDLVAVAEWLKAADPDVVLLQEVQRRQARRLARLLGHELAWRFKHWPIVVPPEGLAVMAKRPLPTVTYRVLAHRFAFWSSKRRVAVATTIDGVPTVSIHLGSGVDDEERVRQATLVVELVAALAPAGVIGGDLNTRPGSDVLDRFLTAGFRDAWAEHRPDDPGPTNWPPGPRDRPPTNRLDYVLIGEGIRAVDVRLPDDPVALGSLSDHLPLVATLEPHP